MYSTKSDSDEGYNGFGDTRETQTAAGVGEFS